MRKLLIASLFAVSSLQVQTVASNYQYTVFVPVAAKSCDVDYEAFIVSVLNGGTWRCGDAVSGQRVGEIVESVCEAMPCTEPDYLAFTDYINGIFNGHPPDDDYSIEDVTPSLHDPMVETGMIVWQVWSQQ